MSYTVNFYQFNKENNSTLRPTNTPESFQCIIKRGSGLINPRIELDIGLTQAPSWNYCYIPDFRRYYYVSEWFYDKALWTANLTCDVLATYRAEIGSSNLYALRTSVTSLIDGRIVDTLYTTKVNPVFSRTVQNSPYESIADGVFILGITSRQGQSGSIAYFAITRTGLTNLLSGLMDNVITADNDFNLTDASKGLQLSLVNPLQYIKSAVFIPIPFNDIIGVVGSGVTVYNWNITVGANQVKLLGAYVKNYEYDLEIKKHPQTNTRGNYVNCSPYTVVTLSVPPFGVIEIDTSAICNLSALTCRIRIDLFNGKGVLKVFAGDNLLNRLESQIGVPVQLSQITRDYMGMFNNIMSAGQSIANSVGSFMSGNIAGGIGGIFGAGSGIGNACASVVPRSQSVGSGGSYAQLYENMRLDFQFFELVDDDINKNGRPCCKVVQPQNNTGYYLIQDGDIIMSGTSEEAEEVRRYLESGFYWE